MRRKKTDALSFATFYFCALRLLARIISDGSRSARLSSGQSLLHRAFSMGNNFEDFFAFPYERSVLLICCVGSKNSRLACAHLTGDFSSREPRTRRKLGPVSVRESAAFSGRHAETQREKCEATLLCARFPRGPRPSQPRRAFVRLRVVRAQHRTPRSRVPPRARAMSSLAASLGGVVPARADRRGDSRTARVGTAGRRATVVAHARAGDDLDAPSPTRVAPEDSRWVEAPAPPPSSVRDAPKKVRLRLPRARREITKCRTSRVRHKHPKISRLIIALDSRRTAARPVAPRTRHR